MVQCVDVDLNHPFNSVSGSEGMVQVVTDRDGSFSAKYSSVYEYDFVMIIPASCSPNAIEFFARTVGVVIFQRSVVYFDPPVIVSKE